MTSSNLVHCSGTGSSAGGWSQRGCVRVDVNESHVTCSCHHLTSFAVLTDEEVSRSVTSAEQGLVLSFEMLPGKLIERCDDISRKVLFAARCFCGIDDLYPKNLPPTLQGLWSRAPGIPLLDFALKPACRNIPNFRRKRSKNAVQKLIMEKVIFKLSVP